MPRWRKLSVAYVTTPIKQSKYRAGRVLTYNLPDRVLSLELQHANFIGCRLFCYMCDTKLLCTLCLLKYACELQIHVRKQLWLVIARFTACIYSMLYRNKYFQYCCTYYRYYTTYSIGLFAIYFTFMLTVVITLMMVAIYHVLHTVGIPDAYTCSMQLYISYYTILYRYVSYIVLLHTGAMC